MTLGAIFKLVLYKFSSSASSFKFNVASKIACDASDLAESAVAVARTASAPMIVKDACAPLASCDIAIKFIGSVSVEARSITEERVCNNPEV